MGNILKTVGNVVTGVANTLSGHASGALSARLFGGKEGYNSYINSLYQTGLTGQQKALQELEDSKYQRTVKDMLMAGINPAAAGQMTGDSAVGPSSQAQVPNEDLLSGLNKIQQTKLLKAQEKAQAIQNVYALEKEYQELQGLIADNEKKGIDNEESKLRLEILGQTIDEQIESYGLVNAKTRSEIRKNKAEAVEQEKRNKYVDQLLSLEVAKGEADVAQIYENIELLKSTVKEKDSITALNEFELELKKATKELQIEYLQAQIALTKATQAYQNSQTALNKNALNEALLTFQDRLKSIHEAANQAEERTKQEGERTKQAEKDTKYYEGNRNWDHWLKVTDAVLKGAGMAVGVATGTKAAGGVVKAAGKAAKSAGEVTASYAFDKDGNIYIP